MGFVYRSPVSPKSLHILGSNPNSCINHSRLHAKATTTPLMKFLYTAIEAKEMPNGQLGRKHYLWYLVMTYSGCLISQNVDDGGKRKPFLCSGKVAYTVVNKHVADGLLRPYIYGKSQIEVHQWPTMWLCSVRTVAQRTGYRPRDGAIKALPAANAKRILTSRRSTRINRFL
jgi:hypothetical protein